MKIENGIYMLEVPAKIMEKSMDINLTLIWDKDSLVLIDTGLPDQLNQIHEAFKKEVIPFNKLKMVILTHQDIDHIGSISDILKEIHDRVKVLAHEEEKDYINGEKKPVKLTKLEERLEHFPSGHICLYIKQRKILIAGDILSVKEGLLVKADQDINFDNELNMESMKKLTNYDIEAVICYHGGIYKGM